VGEGETEGDDVAEGDRLMDGEWEGHGRYTTNAESSRKKISSKGVSSETSFPSYVIF